MRLLLVCSVMFSAVGCGAAEHDSDPATPTLCEKVRDRLADASVQDAAGVDRAAHAAAMKKALGDRAIANCQEHLTVAQANCIIVADTPDAQRKCETATGQ